MEPSNKYQDHFVLQISSYGRAHLGGLEAAAEMLHKYLPDKNWRAQWIFCGTSTQSPRLGECSLPFFDFFERATGIPMPVPKITSIRQLWVKVQNADCILIHDTMYLTSVIAVIAALRFGKPFVLLVHVWKVPYRSRLVTGLQACARTIFGSLCARTARAIITYNRAIFTELKEKFGPSKCYFVANGIHDEFCGGGARMAGAGPRRRQIVFAGRFVEKKGLHLIRKAAAKFQDVDFLICGSGPIDPNAWRLSNVRTMLAKKTQLRAIFEEADLLLLPSCGEGFPLVIQEAMRCGLRCAIFRETWEAWGHGDNLFVLLDESNWLESLEKFLREKKSTIMSAAIRAYAIEHWDWKQTAEKYRNIFSDAIEPAARTVAQSAQRTQRSGTQ
jgi:alpha-maltose-1-phosphate synthase